LENDSIRPLTKNSHIAPLNVERRTPNAER
jgi:hypothetical protein